MPKLKTHSGLKDRFHVTGSGKIMRVRIGKSHFRRRKAKRTKRLYARTIPLHPSDEQRIKKVLPKGLR